MHGRPSSFLFGFLLILLSGGAGMQAHAGTVVTFSDLTDGSPTISATGSFIGAALISAVENEGAAIAFDLDGQTLSVGTRALEMVEPVGDPGGPAVSDVVFAEVFPEIPAACAGATTAGVCQTVRLFFFSDGFVSGGALTVLPDFNAVVDRASLFNPATLVEDGSVQDVTTLLGLSPDILQVFAQSDVSTATDVPEPGSAALLLAPLLLLLVRLQARSIRGSLG